MTYFQDARVLSRRQTHWAQLLTHFDFVIIYHPGIQQGKAYALSQRSYMELRPGEPAFEHKKRSGVEGSCIPLLDSFNNCGNLDNI